MRNVTIWGNHSSTQFPDVAHAYVEDGKKPVYEAVNDDAWLKGDFIKVKETSRGRKGKRERGERGR